MKNIFIIGNGFDLAHGYKTDYKSFIECLIVKNKEIEGLFVKNTDGIRKRSEIIIKIKGFVYYIKSTNSFFKKIIDDFRYFKTWCNIEELYFKELQVTKDSAKLNNEFAIVKEELKKYLIQFNNSKNKIHDFSLFFRVMMSPSNENLVLNFNYTNTFQRLYGDFNKATILNFHGQLDEDFYNPIIFGYAPTDDETSMLIKKNNNEFLKNIKKYYYKQTDNELKLNKFLFKENEGVKNEMMNVFIVGHSCGISDRNILNKILTSSHNMKINIMYYENHNGYFDALVNIDRVVDGDKEFKGIVSNFKSSLKTPQIIDGGKEDSFRNTLKFLKSEIDCEKVKKEIRKSREVDVR